MPFSLRAIISCHVSLTFYSKKRFPVLPVYCLYPYVSQL